MPVGTVLRDFTIQSVIGHGGFGVVYRAGHNELDLTVAIKEYLPVELAVREGATVRPRSGTVRRDFEDGLRRFRDEAQVLVGFDSHPSIVSCRDFFRDNGTAYLVMAYEDGRSLAEVLASREADGRPFTESDLLAVMTPVLEGLARIHAAEVLHRDIKPSNILIRRTDERPVLIDFGAAKQAAARFTKSLAPYTEGYAALEQVADAGKLGPWTDMYGVGAVMWRMVAGGNRPWEPPHPVRVEQRSHAVVGATDDPMPPASELGKGRFQPRLLEAIDRCLRLREAERIQGARELLEALRLTAGQSPSVASGGTAHPLEERAVPDGVVSRSASAASARERSKGLRRVWWLALGSLAVGFGLVLASWWSPDSEQLTQDREPLGTPDAPGGEVGTMEQHEPLDPAGNPRPASPKPRVSANATSRVPDPTGNSSGREEQRSEAESGRENDGSPELRPDRSQESLTQPWIRDWDALGDLRDPGFAGTAQAYIARYGKVPEATVWVAKAAGLLAELRKLEAEARPQGDASDSWTKSLDMEFVWIPEGRFLMGSPEDEEGRYRNERQHEVRISEGFWIQKYEVTQGEWEAVIGTNPSHFSNCGSPCPVESVSWEDVREFIRRLNERESDRAYRYRLPTEAEWEYAARAGTVWVRHGELDSIAWYGANSDSRTHPVGQKRANSWGLHDMLGNVAEWTGDWYGEYASGTVTNPKGPGSGWARVNRGGSWSFLARNVRSASRNLYAPGDRSSSFGFRLVRTK